MSTSRPLELVCALDNRLDLFDDAAKTCDEAIALAGRLFGKRGLPYAEALEGKAEVLIERGDTGRSVELADAVLTILQRPRPDNADLYARTNILLGKTSYLVAFGEDNYGAMLRELSRFEEAERYLTTAISTYTALYGHDHPDVARVQTDLGLMLAAEGRRSDAEHILREALQSVAASRGDDSAAAIATELHLAHLQMDRGRPAEAFASYERVLQSAPGKGAANRPRSSDLKVDEAQALIQLGSVQAANGLLHSVQAGSATTVPSISDVPLLLRQGEAQLSQGDRAGAQHLFHTALEFTLQPNNDTEDLLPAVLFDYVQVLPERNVAGPLLARLEIIDIVKRLRSVGGLSVDDSVELLTGLARLEQACGNLSAARDDFQRALLLRTQYDDVQSPWLAQLDAMFAEYWLQAGDLEQAAVYFARADASLAANPVTLPFFIDFVHSAQRSSH